MGINGLLDPGYFKIAVDRIKRALEADAMPLLEPRAVQGSLLADRP